MSTCSIPITFKLTLITLCAQMMHFGVGWFGKQIFVPIYRLRNDESVSITCLSFHLLKKDCIIFADKEGHIGSFDNTLPTSRPTNQKQDSTTYNNDLLANEDSLMEVSTCTGQVAYSRTSFIRIPSTVCNFVRNFELAISACIKCSLYTLYLP